MRSRRLPPTSGRFWLARQARVAALCLLGLLPMALPANAVAQAAGQVAGVVSDKNGSVLPGAAVELVNAATGQARTAHTGRDGAYIFPLVAPGVYQLHASAEGFTTYVANSVEVQVNGTTRVSAKLAVGSTITQVVVTGAAPLIETANATLGNVVNRESVVDLPLNGRNFAQLGTLIPGVVAAPAGLGGAAGNATVGGFGNTTGSYNVNGMRNQSNSFLLDGAPNNDSFNSGFVMRPPPDAIEEFKIMSHSWEAEYGRNAGSVVNVVTRSGTNQVHGGIWNFNRNGALAARTFFARAGSVPKPIYLQNQFGAAAGGPIKKDAIFLFGFYEGFRLKDGTANTINVLVPGSNERVGNFYETLPATSSWTCATVTAATPGVILDPLTGQPACYNGTPNAFDPARISAISAAILSAYVPLPSAPASTATQGQYVAFPANIDNRDQFGLRGDWKLGRHALLARYLYAHQNLFDPVAPSNFAPKGNYQIMTPTDEMASDLWTINSHLVNTARFVHQHIDGVPNRTSGLDLAALGYGFAGTNQTAAGLPNDTLAGSFTTGDAQQPFAYRANGVISVTDDLTWVAGKHLFQFGAEVERDAIDLLYINRPNGNFTFDPYWTGNVLADFVLGLPYEFQQGSGDPALNGTSWTYAGYAQDEYRATRRLTLQLGLRYELNLPFVERNNHLASLVPGEQSSVEPNAPVGLVYPGDKGVPRGTYCADTTNFAPRLGAIVDPFGDGRTSIRAGWGLFYDTTPGQGTFFQDGTLAPPFQPLQQINFYSNAGPPTDEYFTNPYSGVATGAAGFPPGLTFIGWQLPHSYRTPRVQQYNFSVQQQVTGAMGFEAGYVGSRGSYIPIFIEVNPTGIVATPTGTNAYKSAGYANSPFPAFGLTRPTFSAGRSWYDSLQANLQLRNLHGLAATLAYTWSHSLDNASGLNIGSDSRPVLAATIGNQSSIDAAVAREKGPSLYDARNRVVLSLVYEVPSLARHGAAAREVTSGWKLNTIFQMQSGSPFAVVNPNNTAQSLTFRPNQICNPNIGARHDVRQFFNTACFVLPTTIVNGTTQIDNSRSGDAARNSVVGPGFNSIDASLFKTLRLHENDRIELRFEVFNLFNEAHFANPVATYGDPKTTTFGQITSTVGSDARIIQLAAKVAF